MAGTSMLTDLASGEWRKETLKYLGLTANHFPPMVNAGDVVGNVSSDIAILLGVPVKTPVISAGHDTQFALFGSGVEENQPFLSSGTWEILMARAPRPILYKKYLKDGLTTELDSKEGTYNPAIQWLSSAVMEWISTTFFNDVAGKENKYSVMITEGGEAPVGSNGIVFSPKFLLNNKNLGEGSISGLSINTTRGEIYRSALEGLAYQLHNSLISLSQISGFTADKLLVVGGGSKNALWNQIRADVLGLPIHIVDEAESTVMGAAMYAFSGAGIYDNANEAQQKMKSTYTVVNPSNNQNLYKNNILEVKNA